MMLEALFAHQSQEQAFLALMLCGLAAGGMLHLGTALRRAHPLLCALWDGLTCALCAIMFFMVMLRFHGGLRAYGLLGLLLGVLLYMAGAAPILTAVGGLFQKYKNFLRQKAGKSPSDDESTVQTTAKE